MSRALTLTLAFILTTALAAPAAATPAQNHRPPGETAAYWTAERMKNAKPRERARPGGGGGGGKATDWSRYSVATTDPAYKMNGKLFMTFGTTDYVCSGTAVNAASDVNLVWTAGHCVSDGPSAAEQATNVLFVPAYRNGSGIGVWESIGHDAAPGWKAQGADRFTYDVGAVKVRRQDTSSLTTFTAALGGTRAIDFGTDPTTAPIVAYGYPAAGKFNGATQTACSSPFRRWDFEEFVEPMQISCDMTGGSSGGGWVRDLNGITTPGDGGGPVISVNSYGRFGEKTTMYGPYMADGGEAEQLYDRFSRASD